MICDTSFSLKKQESLLFVYDCQKAQALSQY